MSFLQGWSFLLLRVFQGDMICIDDPKSIAIHMFVISEATCELLNVSPCCATIRVKKIAWMEGIFGMKSIGDIFVKARVHFSSEV